VTRWRPTLAEGRSRAARRAYHRRITQPEEALLGQRIEIESAVVVDDSLIVTTNRSLTGTDGEGFDSVNEARDGGTFAAKLTYDLFEMDKAIRRVYVASNVVIVTRDGTWTTQAKDATAHVVEEFFLYYPAAQDVAQPSPA